MPTNIRIKFRKDEHRVNRQRELSLGPCSCGSMVLTFIPLASIHSTTIKLTIRILKIHEQLLDLSVNVNLNVGGSNPTSASDNAKLNLNKLNVNNYPLIICIHWRYDTTKSCALLTPSKPRFSSPFQSVSSIAIVKSQFHGPMVTFKGNLLITFHTFTFTNFEWKLNFNRVT